MTTIATRLGARVPGVIRSEYIRLWRPSLRYVGLGLTAAFAVLTSAIMFWTAESRDDSAASAGRPGGDPSLSIEALEDPGGFLGALGLLGDLVGLIVLALWALAVASDYDSGLIRILAQAEPNRHRLLGGKIVALVAFTALVTATTTLVVILVSRPFARFAGISSDAWSTDFGTELLSGYTNLTIAAIAWGAIGLLIAVITRSSGVAIAVGIGYILVFEGLIGIVADELVDYLPGGTIGVVASGTGGELDWLPALALTLAYTAAACAVALAVFRRRDIVS